MRPSHNYDIIDSQEVRTIRLSVFIRILLTGLLCFTLSLTSGNEYSHPIVPRAAKTTVEAFPDIGSAVLSNAGDGRLLVCRYRKLDDGSTATMATVININNDVVVAQQSLRGTLTPVRSCHTNNKILLLDKNDRCVHVLDHRLQSIRVISLRNTDGVFSHDGERYYYCEMGAIACHDLTNGTVTAVKTAYDLRFQSIVGSHPTDDLLVVKAYTDAYRNSTCTAIFNPKSGHYKLLTTDVSSAYLFEDKYLSPYVSTDSDKTSLLYGKLNNTDTQVLIDPPGNLDRCLWISGSPYLLYDGVTLYRFTNSVAQCSLASSGIHAPLTNVIYLLQENLLVGISGNELVMINPDALSFKKVTAVTYAEGFTQLNNRIPIEFSNTAYNLKVATNLTDCRRFADRIEEEYGITILLSNECVIPCVYSGYDISPTNSLGYYERENAFINYTLQQLEETLARYPKGFFHQFRNAAGDGGIRVLLTGTINIALYTVGYQYCSHEWYNVVLDVTGDSLDGTISHEIWHATEQLIQMRNPSVFSDSNWSTYNPDGFQYVPTEDYDDDVTYTPKGGNEVYFVRPYAKISAFEDRACLMEAVMCPEYYDTEKLLTSPHVRKKLQVLCDATRNAFNSSSWKDVYWERYQ